MSGPSRARIVASVLQPARRSGSYQREKPLLGVLPLLPEPFDLVQSRRGAIDATVRLEGRNYSVPFRYADRVVELRGCA
jgi:hypothetical protein